MNSGRLTLAVTDIAHRVGVINTEMRETNTDVDKSHTSHTYIFTHFTKLCTNLY